MQLVKVPGFKDFFGTAPSTYEDLLDGIPSYQVIEFLITINRELKVPESSDSIQRRLRRIIASGLSVEEIRTLNSVFLRVKTAKPDHTIDVFQTRYLIEMVLRELNRNFDPNRTIANRPDEFKIFQAYLLVIDDINAIDDQRYMAACSIPEDKLTDVRLLWINIISLFEFIETPHTGFAIYKAFHLVNFLREEYPNYLKEYLDKFNLKTPGEFLSSFFSLAKAAISYFPKKVFRTATYIVPETGIDDSHLRGLSVNSQMGARSLQLMDIKKYPLFESTGKGYSIIDSQFFLKKIYLGPFFEIIHETSLKKYFSPNDQSAFNTYSTLISNQVLEKRCFKQVVQTLVKSRTDVFHTDDGSDNSPDAFYRMNKTIFLIEFKGSIFQEKLVISPDFEKIKSHIDDRFVTSPAGSRKGVTQLANQISQLAAGAYSFDMVFNEELKGKMYWIYPIVCHTDHYFAMPGVNEYLQSTFDNALSPTLAPNVILKNLTVLSLEKLFLMANYGSDFGDLEDMIIIYHRRKEKRASKNDKTKDINVLADQYQSFDDMFDEHFARQVIKPDIKTTLIDSLEKDIPGFNQPIP